MSEMAVTKVSMADANSLFEASFEEMKYAQS
jgi:hypothetical protein